MPTAFQGYISVILLILREKIFNMSHFIWFLYNNIIIEWKLVFIFFFKEENEEDESQDVSDSQSSKINSKINEI